MLGSGAPEALCCFKPAAISPCIDETENDDGQSKQRSGDSKID